MAEGTRAGAMNENMRKEPPRRKRVGLVIGAGSVKCAAAVGAQKALARAGIDIDLVVGCSAGAIYAALIAAGLDAETIGAMTRRVWTRELTSPRDRRALLSVMMPRLFGFGAEFGLRSDRLIMQRLNEVFGDMAFETMKIPLFITATDFENGELVCASSGSIVDAMRASLAVPFVFKPHRVQGRLCLDGYLSDPMPVGVAIREGADVIIALGFESPYQEHISSAARFAFQVASVMTNNLRRASYAFHSMAHHDEVISVVPQFKQRIRMFDTAKIEYIIEEGERATEEQMPYVRRLLDATAQGN
ncbi:MAG: patatin-like phospholipase family protein [Burkholderiales bacterium]|nr:MAG: patatin-like phospholipase family protein [Burkholderiales bacterium]